MAAARTVDADRPILVTGVPRSGTTWLARLLTNASRTALAGREPMNPRDGGYALGKTVDGWARLRDLSPRQRRVLRMAFAGWNPLCFGRYGSRQWAAPLPGVRVIVKDPFAVLSLRVIVSTTRARVILVYRHPAAVLTSYRRMGWTHDLEELRAALSYEPASGLALPRSGEWSEAEEFGAFWAGLHSVPLADREYIDMLVVSHEELAAGGRDAANRVFDALGLAPGKRLERELQDHQRPAAYADSHRLHNFDRDPADVARQWRDQISSEELRDVERAARPALEQLDAIRLPLS